MLYAIWASDHADSQAARQAARPAHLERLNQLQAQGDLFCAGPLPLNEQDLSLGVTGSLIIARFDHLAAAQAWAAADPYVAAKVYKEVIIKPFKPVYPSDFQ